MNQYVYPSTIQGTVCAPPSKSAMQRACALALLCKGSTLIKHPGVSNDDKAAMSLIKDLGAILTTKPDGSLHVMSSGIQPQTSTIHCGESGLSMRMFTPLAALSASPICIQGTGSLVGRPMNFFDEVFPLLGVRIQSTQHKLPLSVQGPLQVQDLHIDGSLSSQFLTGLIFAFVASPKQKTHSIYVQNLKSKPYIDLTLDMLKHFGAEVRHEHYERFDFKPSEQLHTRNEYTVEGDWSGAAFLLVAGAIGGSVKVSNLSTHSTQGDKAIIQAIQDAGALVSFHTDGISVAKQDLRSFEFDATDCPDLFPPLVALAVHTKGVSTLKGVSRLAFKESNRGLTLQTEFQKLGYRIDIDGDKMYVAGGGENHEVGTPTLSVSSHHDHRIAMALALAGIYAPKGGIVIEYAEAIDKSYPSFFRDMEGLGLHTKTL